MKQKIESLVPISGLKPLLRAAATLTEPPKHEAERAAIQTVLEPLMEAALITIQLQLDHADGDHNPEVDFGRVLAVAQHC